jgi:hypothetical protein
LLEKKSAPVFYFSFIVNGAFCFWQEVMWQNTVGGSGMEQLWTIEKNSNDGLTVWRTSNSNIDGMEIYNEKLIVE